MMTDTFGRVHDYLRISLTDNCNLRCMYCMPEDDYEFASAAQLMQPDEILTLAKIFVDAGVNKIRLTGGEPLVRKEAADIIKALATLPVNLTMTTNATRLHLFIDVLRDAGLHSLNVSLDTLQADKFILLTKRDQFELTYNNILMGLQQGFHMKVNVVVMKGVNDHEILDFIALTEDMPLHVRFIEFMPFSGNHWSSDKVVTLDEMLQIIGTKYEFDAIPRLKHATTKGYQIPGYAGTFAVISTMSSHFCGDCNRLRLTADGKIKNCLFSKVETDLLTALRKGDDVLPLIKQSVHSKAKQLGGQFEPDFTHVDADLIENRSMITIGG
jgi:GTP 3',8-cyclase